MANFVSKSADIVEIPITKEMRDFAQANAHKGSMNKHSLLQGAQNVEGLLAELAVHRYLPMLSHDPGNEYDFTFPYNTGTFTIDVKNKFDVKRYGTRPNMDWDCTIFGYEVKKKCDIYLFTSTNGDNTKVWLKGYIAKKRFVLPENFYKAGSTRTTTQGSVNYKRDNYVVQVKELYPVEFLKKRLSAVIALQT